MNAVKNDILNHIYKELSLKLKHSELKLININQDERFVEAHSNVFISISSHYMAYHFISIASYEDVDSPTGYVIYISLMKIPETVNSSYPTSINTLKFNLPETKTETMDALFSNIKSLLLECIL